MENIENLIQKRQENFKKLEITKKEIKEAVEIIQKAIFNGNKVIFCGNGGSASDSNHLACEFISRFQRERKSIPAISLTANNSIITAISNDYSFEDVFKRQIEALGQENDVLVAISTSGKSKNVIEAVKKAKEKGLKIVILTGQNKVNFKSDVEINVPSLITCEIQEMHIAIGHIICQLVENSLFSK